MTIDAQFLEHLQQYKIKNGLESVSLYESYLYINGYKLLFITRNNRNKRYQIFGSSACHFEPIRKFGTFELLFMSEDRHETISMFQSYIIRTFCNNELHSTTTTESLQQIQQRSDNQC